MPKPPEGLPAYGFETLLKLAGLATAVMLRRERREPAAGQKPVACYWTGYEYALLYRAADAATMPPLSPGRQRRYDANRTCPDCGAKRNTPWPLCPDGKRYCHEHLEPAAERFWHVEQAARVAASRQWAQEVLADPRAVLIGVLHTWWACAVRIEDVAGQVLVDAVIRSEDRDGLTAEQLAMSVPAAEVLDRVAALTDRRPVAWWPQQWYRLVFDLRTTGLPAARDALAVAAGDDYGKRWSNWLGERPRWATNYLHNQDVAQQNPPGRPGFAPLPGEVVGHVEAMRAGLAEMATGTPPPHQPEQSDGTS